ncbi:MAG TPA: tetratricopeptide repeat protein [Terriglobia bacterium]|nr:tetratricopeptide repeat protein [Terriglobia bacterium]
MQTSELISTNSGADDRLSSWKEIATYLKCGVRTVQRWEQLEALPVHRHQHQKNGTVYAFRSELDAWRKDRTNLEAATPVPGGSDIVLGIDRPDRVSDRSPGHGSADGAAEPAFDVQETNGEVPNAQGPGGRVQGPGIRVDQARLEASNPEGDGNASIASVRLPRPEAAPASAAPDISAPKRLTRSWLLPFSLLVALAVVVSAAVYIARERLRTTPRPQVTRKMLAVLPFANLSGDPAQDYFSDGLTEEMITELGRLDPERLGVIARTSAMKYKRTQEDIAQIGKELGVSYVLEGSVRRAQNRVRVSAQLIQVSDQTHLWAQNYEADMHNVLGVQEQVANAITSKIQVKLGRGQQTTSRSPQTLDEDAYDNYLKGRYFWNLRTNDGFRKAIGYFNNSIQRDPNYAQSYAGLADCYTLLALYGEPVQEVMPRAQAAARKSVALNDSLPEAHTSLGAVEALWEWNWPAAEREFQRAINLDPNYSPAHHWYANLYLIPQGRLDEAIAEMKRAATLDPVSLIVTTDLGWSYFVSDQYDSAFEQYSKALEMSPEFLPVHFRLSQYYLQKGAYDQALAQSEQAIRLDGYHGSLLTEFAGAAPVTQQDYRKFLRRRLEEINSGRPDLGASPAKVPLQTDPEGRAAFYVELDETDQALKSLQGAVNERDPGLIYLAVDPVFAALHSDPRFQEIERRIGLPARQQTVATRRAASSPDRFAPRGSRAAGQP